MYGYVEMNEELHICSCHTSANQPKNQSTEALSLCYSPSRPMPALTHDQVRHIAKLARLTLTDAEVEKFATELTSILAYVDRLTQVDTKGIEPLKSVTGLSNNWRDDVVRDDGANPDALLECSPLPITDHQIQTPSAHG